MIRVSRRNPCLLMVFWWTFSCVSDGVIRWPGHVLSRALCCHVLVATIMMTSSIGVSNRLIEGLLRSLNVPSLSHLARGRSSLGFCKTAGLFRQVRSWGDLFLSRPAGRKRGAAVGTGAPLFISVPILHRLVRFWADKRPIRSDQARSKRSRFITLVHAAMKSLMNFGMASSDA